MSLPSSSKPPSSPSSSQDERARMWQLAAPFAAIGIEVAASVVTGALLGHGIDVWQQTRTPVGFFVGTAVGCTAAGRALLRLVRFQRRQEAQARAAKAKTASATPSQPNPPPIRGKNRRAPF